MGLVEYGLILTVAKVSFCLQPQPYSVMMVSNDTVYDRPRLPRRNSFILDLKTLRLCIYNSYHVPYQYKSIKSTLQTLQSFEK